MKTNKNSVTRREFLKSSAVFGAVTILPSYIALGNRRSGLVAPNEKVNLAVIGIGHQGDRDRKQMVQSGHCNVVALCDVDLEGEHVQGTLNAHPKAKRFTDFRVMFDRMADQIDAVLIATPDHSHFCATMLAMDLGKHVYVEKPLAHTFGQCERLMQMEEKTGVVTQMGNQGHSGANYFQFKAWSEAGVIKDVTKVTAFMTRWRRWHGWGETATKYPTDPMPEGIDWDQWIDSAPVHPYSQKLHPQEWRSWFHYGSGAFGDWGPHILDTCHEFLEFGLPQKITAVKRLGENPFVYPQKSTIRFNFPARGKHPACEVTWYDGQDNDPELDTSAAEGLEPETLKGAGKVIYSKDLVFKGGTHGSALQIIPREKMMDLRESLPKFPQKNSNHYANFILSCKGEEKTRSPFSVAGPLSQTFNLGCIAQRIGGEINFDRETKQIEGNKLASAFLDPKPRGGWEEFYKLHQ
ncbi:oxidoreductase [Coraliomargarita sinensis]|uniref:Oxidoreductase n=1 Tax=Coraliomargarita sinensis TaxID=2174842 RepID=A0A317ZJN1_9BACT|nr:Gfo/Idh/MocA family oxidoreductase [Coraliomargarita sinensis]PXA04423.1 oxidoreductase [Coraliomargarita sinensis]